MPERNTDDPERDFALLAYVRAYLRDAEEQDFVIPTTAIDQYVHAIVRLANRELRSPSRGGKRPAQGNHPAAHQADTSEVSAVPPVETCWGLLKAI